MLSKPEFGWTNFSLGNIKVSISNIFTPLPQGWIEEAIRGLQHNQPFVVYGWCEPEYIFCTVTENFCYVVHENTFEFVNLTMKDFCKILYSDISQSISEWID